MDAYNREINDLSSIPGWPEKLGNWEQLQKRGRLSYMSAPYNLNDIDKKATHFGFNGNWDNSEADSKQLNEREMDLEQQRPELVLLQEHIRKRKHEILQMKDAIERKWE